MLIRVSRRVWWCTVAAYGEHIDPVSVTGVSIDEYMTNDDYRIMVESIVDRFKT